MESSKSNVQFDFKPDIESYFEEHDKILSFLEQVGTIVESGLEYSSGRFTNRYLLSQTKYITSRSNSMLTNISSEYTSLIDRKKQVKMKIMQMEVFILH